MRNKFDAKHIKSICGHAHPDDPCYPTMTAEQALDELCRYFLGSGWYDCSGATCPEQVNVNIVCEIEKRYKGAKLKRKVTYE